MDIYAILTVDVAERKGGGLYVNGANLRGLSLSGPNPSQIRSMIIPAAKTLLEHDYGIRAISIEPEAEAILPPDVRFNPLPGILDGQAMVSDATQRYVLKFAL